MTNHTQTTPHGTTPYQHRLYERAERGTQTQGEVIDNLLSAIEQKDAALTEAAMQLRISGGFPITTNKCNHALNEYP